MVLDLNPDNVVDRLDATPPLSPERQTKLSVFERASRKIKQVFEMVKSKFGFGNRETVAIVDEALVDIARQTESVTDVETVLVEGALEDTGSVISDGANPIDDLEASGLSDVVTIAVEELARQESELPTGESIAEVVAEHIDRNNAVDIDLLRAERAKVEADCQMIEQKGYCREAGKLRQQAQESDRTARIVSIKARWGVGVIGHELNDNDRLESTEQDSLADLVQFLEKIAKVPSKYSDYAKDVLENLTWIGEKEHNEAARVLAEYWKHQLRNNPNLHIVAISGMITENMVKSDTFLLEKIMSNFSDEELDEFSSRLLLSVDDIPEGTLAEDVKIIMLDDWTISGSQLSGVKDDLDSKVPQYKQCLEMNLVVASQEQLDGGASYYDSHGNSHNVAIKSCFLANKTTADDMLFNGRKRGAIITGYHSSVDFDFENVIVRAFNSYNSQSSNNGVEPIADMPLGINIVRPYRINFSGNNIERAKKRRRAS